MSELLGLLLLVVIAGIALILIMTAIIAHGARHPPRHTVGYAIARNLPSDPEELGLDYEEWLLDLPDGVRLPVWEIVPADPPHESASHFNGTVIFLHGWGQSRIDMLEFAPHWLSRANRLIFYDLPGHGEAIGSLTALGAGEEHDLIALLDHLDPQRAQRFLLVGLSMGAVIAIHAAATLSEANDTRVAGVIALGPYDSFHRSLRGRLRGAGYPTRPMTELAMIWFRFIGIHHWSTRDSARRLAPPLLVIHGDDDAMVPIEEAESIVAAAPQATLQRVEGAGHLDLPRVGIEQQHHAIDAFLSGIEA